MKNKIQIWAAQSRANFLVLSVVLVLIGWALSWETLKNSGDPFPWLDAVLSMIGIVVAHASVNLFNEYSDYKTGIDFHTNKSPFSGGSGMLIKGNTKSKAVLYAALGTLVVSGIIGFYLSISSNMILFLFLFIGAFTIAFYTNILARFLMGELLSGITLGSMVVIGTYIALTANSGSSFAELFPSQVVYLSIPPGILTALLLFINEFPDAEADKQGGRHHLVIYFGKKKASIIYAFFLIFSYLILIILPILGQTSYWVYLALLTLPFAFKAISGLLKNYNQDIALIPAQGSHVITTLLVDFLIAAAIFIQIF